MQMVALQGSVGNAAVSRMMAGWREYDHDDASNGPTAESSGDSWKSLDRVPASPPEPLRPVLEALVRLMRAHRDRKTDDGAQLVQTLSERQKQDYQQGLRPDLELRHTEAMLGHLHEIAASRTADGEVDRWCVANETWLDETRRAVEDAIRIAAERWENYGYYLMYEFGTFWDETVDARGVAGASHLDWFKDMSRDTIRALDDDAAVVEQANSASGARAPSWMEVMRKNVEKSLRRCVLRHYTPAGNIEQILASGGALKSKALLDNEGADFAHKTHSVDEGLLGDTGFVFFFIEPLDAAFRGSRFGGTDPARITLPIDMLEKYNGWVMLTDFFDREFPTLRADDEGNLISYVRSPSTSAAQKAKKFDQSRFKDGQYIYSDVPEGSPEGRLIDAVYGINELHSATERQEAEANHILKLADAFDRLASGRADGRSATTMVHIVAEIRKAQRRLRSEIDPAKLSKLVEERRRALADSRRYPHKVRKYVTWGEAYSAEGMRYHDAQNSDNPSAYDLYHEPYEQNLLVGADVIPGLARRLVVEVARMQRQNQPAAQRLISMGGDELLRVFLKSFIRPQAMLQKQVGFSRENIEFLKPRAGSSAPRAPRA